MRKPTLDETFILVTAMSKLLETLTEKELLNLMAPHRLEMVCETLRED